MSNERSSPKAENSNLPIVSEVIKDEEILVTARDLLKEAARLKPRLDEYEARLKQIKSELTAIASSYDLSGFRLNKIGFRYSGMSSVPVLSKEKILYIFADVGLPAEKLSECYVKSAEFEKSSIILFE